MKDTLICIIDNLDPISSTLDPLRHQISFCETPLTSPPSVNSRALCLRRTVCCRSRSCPNRLAERPAPWRRATRRRSRARRRRDWCLRRTVCLLAEARIDWGAVALRIGMQPRRRRACCRMPKGGIANGGLVISGFCYFSIRL